MRMGNTAPGAPRSARRPPRGRQAHGAPLHRRRDARRPRSATLRELWKGGVAARSTCSARRRSRRPRPQRYAERCARGARHARRGRARLARAAGARGRRRRAAPAGEPVASRSPRSRRCCAPTRPSAASATPPTRLRALLRRARELGAHLHIDMESLDSRDAVARARPGAAGRGRVPRRAVGRHGAAGLPARLARHARHDARLDHGRGRAPRPAR